jgi:hypothetical protein
MNKRPGAAAGRWCYSARRSVAAALLLSSVSAFAETEAITKETPWRVFLVCNLNPRGRAGLVANSPAPPANWMQADFDDGGWGRYGSDLVEQIGVTGGDKVALFLRAYFAVSDPAQASDLTLTLGCPGEATVYVNGKQVPRQGAFPGNVLRRGANTLAIEVRAPVGLTELKLASASGKGPVSYAEALKAVTLSNATAMDTIAERPRLARGMANGIAKASMPLARGNPFEPIRPLRAIAPRGGTGSAQVVVSGPAPFSGLQAGIAPLRQAAGKATLPARLAYGQQSDEEDASAALQPSPAASGAVQPVWVLVDVPREQPPGWYTGELQVAVGAQRWSAPVQFFVAGWTTPLPEQSATLLSIYQSPDTLADYYKVEPWSDRHFALIGRSLNIMGKTGNDVLLVPVAIQNYLNHKHGLIRWVKKGADYEPEFGAFERYLDLFIAAFGKPKVVTLSVWKHDFGTRTWFRGMKNDTVKPCLVTEYNPATKEMKPMEAPHFGAPGSEEFWKKMTDGARRVLKAKGVSDRFLLLGEAFDSRPLEAHRAFWAKIEPTMRWQIYSHFDGGEPPIKDGKFICHGGFDVGLCIKPNDGGLPEFWRKKTSETPLDFLWAQAARTYIHATASPLAFRAVLQGVGRGGGTLGRIGLDFWPIGKGKHGRPASYYSCPPNEGWLWRAHVPALTAPGPEGAVLTTRAQMLIEAVQEAEATIALIRAKPTASPELAKRIETCRAERHAAYRLGEALAQSSISLDWNGIAAREYAVAAELAGTPGVGDWNHPLAMTADER